MAAGSDYVIGLKTDGRLFGWGDNGASKLSAAVTNSWQLSPKQLSPTADWAFVAAGGAHTLAIKTDGTVWAWGYNNDGQLGDGQAKFAQATPEQIGRGHHWTFLAPGRSHTLALDTNGTLWGFGGLGRTMPEPVQIDPGNDWVDVASGNFHSLGLKRNGTLWGMGDLATGYRPLPMAPVQIGTDEVWIALAAGGYLSAALKIDGTLWTWGRNEHGQGGDRSVYYPMQVGTETNWGKTFSP